MISDYLILRYPSLSAGYIGIRMANSTLNSAFYAQLLFDRSSFNLPIIFPQRVLKTDFFEEISIIEVDNFYNVYKKLKNNLIEELKESYNSNPVKIINYLNLFLRYGLFNEIGVFNIDLIKAHLNSSEILEINLIKLIAKIKNNNDDPNLELSSIKRIADELLSSVNLTKRIQILSLNFMIVAAYRYGVRLDYNKYLNSFHTMLSNIIRDDSDQDFGARIRQSVAYRGLAMIKEVGFDIQCEYLIKAEKIARNFDYLKNDHEELIAKENLYTCLQTLSKWNIQHQDINAAEENLKEMILIDPFDSTGYGELGFFLMNAGRIEEAANAFKNAAALGPPAVAMHTYYYAKCLQASENDAEAERMLYEVIALDADAVSPWLDLLESDIKNNRYSKAREIAGIIINNPIYTEQLDDDELFMIRAYSKK